MSDITDALTGQITALGPQLSVAFASIIGLVFLIALGGFVIRRVRGTVK